MLRDREQEKERAEQRAVREAKRVCALIAKMVRDFWQNVDRVVDLRAQVENFFFSFSCSKFTNFCDFVFALLLKAGFCLALHFVFSHICDL